MPFDNDMAYDGHVTDIDTIDDIEADGDDDVPAPHGVSHRVAAPAEAAGSRLDKLLAETLAGMSRTRLKQLLESGLVSSGARTITDASYRVKPGQTFDVFVPAPEPAQPEPEPIALTIVYEDEAVLVLDKAAGMVVHPAAGNPRGTLVNALLAHCGDSLSGIGGIRRPGIVHRLDKDTSGLMVVAKSDAAHAGLAAQFADRTLSRTYQAVVWGVPSPACGEMTGNIGRSPTDRKKMAVLSKGGKSATTRYRVLRTFSGVAALVECSLLTGRTHQIRVHMADRGHPLIGDPVYGRGRRSGNAGAKLKALPEPVRDRLVAFDRQALHAVAIRFKHPTTQEFMEFSSDLPLDIQSLIDTLERI